MTAALNHDIEQAAEEPALLGVECSARGLRWVERLNPSRHAAALAIAQTHGLPELIGRMLAARGADPRALSAYLDPSIRQLLPDPGCLQDMERAAARFAKAISTAESVAVFGDYDVDGAASVALIERYLRAHGRGVATYIPDRLTEGYGPTPQAMSGLVQAGASLILSVDCGTTAHASIDAATRAGADVIVIDHHQADEALPSAFALVNPNRQDDLSGQGHLAAAGVVFLFLIATTRVLRRQGHYAGGAEPDLLGLLDLVALATVCDVVPLRGVNRAFVAKGLRLLRLRHNAGLRALADAARLDTAPTCHTLGFILGPRINAGGRIGASALGAKLLATDDEMEAASLAARLEVLNAERKAIEAKLLEEAFIQAELECEAGSPFIWLCGEGWHKGLLGLIASRVVERFGLPTFVTSWEGEVEGVGSARSIPSVDLGRVIRKAAEIGLLVKGGGHAMAAGFRIARNREEALRAFLGKELIAQVAGARQARRLVLDGALSASGVTPEFMDILDRTGPYGADYPEPRFAFPAHRLARLRRVSDSLLRCTLIAGDGGRMEACVFRAGDTPLAKLLQQSEGLQLHFAGQLRRDTWNGRNGIELVIDDAAETRSAR